MTWKTSDSSQYVELISRALTVLSNEMILEPALTTLGLRLFDSPYPQTPSTSNKRRKLAARDVSGAINHVGPLIQIHATTYLDKPCALVSSKKWRLLMKLLHLYVKLENQLIYQPSELKLLISPNFTAPHPGRKRRREEDEELEKLEERCNLLLVGLQAYCLQMHTVESEPVVPRATKEAPVVMGKPVEQVNGEPIPVGLPVEQNNNETVPNGLPPVKEVNTPVRPTGRC